VPFGQVVFDQMALVNTGFVRVSGRRADEPGAGQIGRRRERELSEHAGEVKPVEVRARQIGVPPVTLHTVVA